MQEEGQFARQIATVISIDAVGFSRLMSRDAVAAVSAFEERREIIAQICEGHGGRMFGAAGDSLMAEFGNPGEALLAAFEFQSVIAALNMAAPAPRRMPFRAAINTGDVILRGSLLYGDDVNIAARLQELAPPDGVIVSDTTFRHVRASSFATFHDLGEHALKNIAFPVKAHLAQRGTMGGESFVRPSLPGPKRAASGPPAIAVLPFRATMLDESLDYLGDAIAEDVIAGLSGMRWLPVISRSSSFQFRDDSLSVAAAGKALGARYVVTGQVTSWNDQIRVRAVLDDVEGGRTLWSRKLERQMDGVADFQEEIGTEIVAMLEKEVDRAEQARAYSVPWESLETWQLVRRGRLHMHRRTREDGQIAYDYFMKAYARDPNSTAVLNELAWWHFWRAWVGVGTGLDTDAEIGRVKDYSHRALFMDSQDARPHAHLGAADIMLGMHRSALAHLDEAVRINPSYAFARSATGSAFLLMGEAERALSHFHEADRLSPYDLYRFHTLGDLASALTCLRDFEASLEAARASLELSPGYWYASVIGIGALCRMGRAEEATRMLAALEQRHPGFSIDRVYHLPFADRSANAYLAEGFLMVQRQLAAE